MDATIVKTPPNIIAEINGKIKTLASKEIKDKLLKVYSKIPNTPN